MLNWAFSKVASGLKASVIRETLKLSSRPGLINFAGGLPAPELFPVDHLKRICQEVLDKHSTQALQYSITQGVPQLRQVLAERMSAKRNREVSPDNILITTGSQQGLDLIGRAFLEPGDYVLTEQPTYLGALQAFNFYQIRYATVEMDDDGMLTDQVEAQIKKYRPKFIYVVPSFQNPTGITMSLERRKRLVELGAHYNIPIIDDNPYGELRYSGEAPVSLCEMGEGVIQLGTFSKLVSPGLRVAWVCAPPAALNLLERVKQAADLHSTTFTQFVIYEFIAQGLLDDHIELIKDAYSQRRDIMLKAMQEYFPDSVRWPHPHGGLFLWVQLPEGVSCSKIFHEAVEAGVAFVPGQAFHPDGSGDNTFRLNFANATPENIVEGVKRLGSVLKKHC